MGKLEETQESKAFKLELQIVRIQEQWKQCQTLFGAGAPKSLQMVTAAMKLKDTYSMEENL